MDNAKTQKRAQEFMCEKCDYKCCNKFDFNRHLSTRKHIMDNVDNANERNVPTSYDCMNCGNIYKYQSGLCKHRKTCKPRENVQIQIGGELSKEAPVVYDNQSLIHTLVSENKELRNLLVEQAKEYMNFINQQNSEYRKESSEMFNKVVDNVKPITITNNNQAFNINFFLNDTCKDAINFTDFINSLVVSREDLMNTGNVGFVDGVSKILIDTLKQLGVHERPIHCTDLKRETMYIKDDNKWNKEDTDKKVRNAIAMITIQSMKTLHEWKETNPEYKDSNSEFSNLCIPMQMYSVAGPNRDIYYPRVIKAIAKEIVINKSLCN
jgi:hypothetical protein